MKKSPASAARLYFAAFFCFVATVVLAADEITPDRVREIAGWLPASPAGFGWPISDRAAWQKIAASDAFTNAVPEAAALLDQPLPAQPDKLYLEFSRDGNRTHWQKVAAERRNRIAQFTLAECLENRGRFLAPLEKTIAALCAERTWVLPAHDRSLGNFHGTLIEPDLGATGLAAELAEADFLLGDKLSPATRQLIRENVHRRVLDPVRAAVEGRRPPIFWLRVPMNWNAVCVGNTVFADLALADSRDERAWFAAMGEHFIRYSLRGFTPDGYCAEGVGYWNYGYGHDILLFETLRRATGGKIDLFNDDAAIQPALFCLRSEIFPGMFPTIADCAPGSQPAAGLKAYVCRRLGLPNDAAAVPNGFGDLCFSLMLASLEENLPVVQHITEVNPSPLRSYFPFGGVLISRTAADARPPMAVVLKGGHNAEPHNHNDVGSFSVIVGTNMVICDPGGEVYTSRTFSDHRYDSGVLNSFGHAVPLVAGRLQHDGHAAHAVILETNFTDAADLWKLDIHSAYAVEDLTKLERTFVFARGAQPSLTLTDAVAFSAPEKFETALVTWGKVKRVSDNTFLITDGDSAVRVTVETQGKKFSVRKEKINEDVQNHRKPYHVGIVLDEKITNAVVTLKISPVAN
jgi:Heparinase II/III-like protein